jgi:ABC-type transporter Mla maintaining outer membrane lipid asymmetry ATPase subunit MlaF
MTAARKLADHVAVIYGGRIVASGDADTIFGSNEHLVHQLLSGELSGPVQLGTQ